MIGKVVYSYVPESWDQAEFLRLGGFVVVFLNYNKASMIQKSVVSALDQDYPLLEMFFMDDASTDGSGDQMEQIVRSYRGRHKVTVVRNTENQHICGQWNIVSKFATGNWFGMFCADDIAFPNRVSLTADIILKHPDLLGLCTNARSVNMVSGQVDETFHASVKKIFMDGTASFYDAVDHTPIIGASAFWHRSLFEKPLPQAPLDDVLLRVILHSKNYRDSKKRWLWAGDVKTLTYSLGIGITSEGGETGNLQGFDCESKWIARRPFVVRLQKNWLQSLRAAETWMNENRVDAQVVNEVRVRCLDYQYQTDAVNHALDWIPIVCDFRIPAKHRVHLCYAFAMHVVRRYLGLRCAAKIDRLLHRGV